MSLLELLLSSPVNSLAGSSGVPHGMALELNGHLSITNKYVRLSNSNVTSDKLGDWCLISFFQAK